MTDIKAAFAVAISKHVSELEMKEIASLISEPPKPDYGDIAFPCFSLAKVLKKSPALIATDLAKSLEGEVSQNPLFKSVTAAGPFLNLSVEGSVVATDILSKILSEDKCCGSEELNNKVIAVDYSSPNIAKHLGVHHLRSTMIGNSICSIYEKLGYKVLRVNYLGDWGTQFGKLMAALSEASWSVETMTIDQLAHMYVMFTKRAEERPELQEEARTWFKRLEDGDPEATYLWELFRKTSIKEFENLYERLGVSFTEFDGESNYSRAAQLIVEEARQKDIVEIGEGGAILVPMEGKDPPCMLQKSDGATTYLARDVAAVINRFKTHGLSRMLYVVGHAQSLHFKQVFHVVKQLGYDFHGDCVHVPFGLLNFDGSKLSSRKGNMLLLKDVLDVAAEHVAEIVSEKGNSISELDMDKIGIGAVTFADLSRKRTLDVNFKWKDILQFDGSTGPYLQYTLVRCSSIVKKSNTKIEGINFGLLAENEEKLLLLKLAGFGETLQEAGREYDPSRLCNYLLKLAKLTNRYIRNIRIIQEDAELQQARTALIKAVSIVMDEGLTLLGIARLQKM